MELGIGASPDYFLPIHDTGQKNGWRRRLYWFGIRLCWQCDFFVLAVGLGHLMEEKNPCFLKVRKKGHGVRFVGL